TLMKVFVLTDNQPITSPMTPIDPRVEMFQKGQPNDAFFNMKALAPRPLSDATEMFDTDFEDDDSEAEDNSPRLSLNSTGQKSETTLSSFEEIHTPSPSSQEFPGFNFDLTVKKPVEGPRGPHLFRSSVDSSLSSDEQYVLAMSPMTPMTPRPSSRQRAAQEVPRVPDIPTQHRHLSSLTHAVEDLNLNEVSLWTPRQVARWMYDAGFEPSIVEKFEENDISGAILITLKFEDLRELDIPSFGQRTKVWNEIHVLRGSAPSTPKPPTPFEEASSPCTESRQPSRHRSRSRQGKVHFECGSDEEPKRRKSSRRRHRKQDEAITPLESVSIVGIEQLMPKPHKCSKGENCSKWRKQQRLIENFKNEHPVSPEGGSIWVAGNPGNPLTAEAVAEAARPISDAVPSVVASSDVLGPATVPQFQHLEEASLRNVESRDPQDNVQQFLKFQHMDPRNMVWSSEEPSTPPYEMFPALKSPHAGLRGLPRLAIPPPRPAPPPRAASANAFSPYRMERAEAMSPELRNVTQSPASVYRFGTPFSEMDMPLTAVPIGPVAREASQSVPPNMSYRHAPAPSIQRTQSRASARRPSFPAMPRVDENISTVPTTQERFSPYYTQSPPRNHAYPWSPVNAPATRAADDASHAGYMRKRKTKMMRHEWHEHHFTLKGTRLAMHKDAQALETLEYIDVDDYAIACSSLASGSKLNAAFKAMNISRGNKDKKDEAAFAFQLIPAAIEKGVRLRKRESAMMANGQAEGKDAGAKNKTHYFAVKSRDERIDWMRELMLAKALKQKGEGYEVTINGNMI
ncbi:Protein BOI2, partial [Lachnellula cervina]